MRLTRWAHIHEADEQARPSWVSPGARRRQDVLTRLACSTVDKILDPEIPLPTETAVVMATAYGSVASTLKFVDSIKAHGDEGASPTPFTSSVHNATTGTMSELLGLRGPSTTISQGNTSTLAALRWADLMLRSGRCPAVLMIAGDQHHAWSQRVISELAPVKWPLSGGMGAGILEAGEGPGHEIRLHTQPCERVLDNGGTTDAENRKLQRLANEMSQTRQRTGDLKEGWWPTMMWSCLPFGTDSPIHLREIDGLIQVDAWMGSWQDA